MVHHLEIASTQDKIAKFKKMGLEFIAQDELRRAQSTKQLTLFAEETTE